MSGCVWLLVFRSGSGLCVCAGVMSISIRLGFICVVFRAGVIILGLSWCDVFNYVRSVCKVIGDLKSVFVLSLSGEWLLTYGILLYYTNIILYIIHIHIHVHILLYYILYYIHTYIIISYIILLLYTLLSSVLSSLIPLYLSSFSICPILFLIHLSLSTQSISPIFPHLFYPPFFPFPSFYKRNPIS